MSGPEARGIMCCWRDFINTVRGRAKHQDFGQGSKKGKADVSEFGSCLVVTTPIQGHWLAFGVVWFSQRGAESLIPAHEI